MAMTRITDVVVRGGIAPSYTDLGDVMTDPPPAVAARTPDAFEVQPSQNDLLRNALAIDERLAAERGQL